MELNFNLVYQISFENNSFLILQNYCEDLISRNPVKIFKSINLSPTSTSEKLLISLIQNKNLQISEIQIWEQVLKWGFTQNPELPSDPTNFSKEDFNTLKNGIQQFIPYIEFYNLTSEEFSDKVLPYKKILPKELYKNLLKYFLKPNNQKLGSDTIKNTEEISEEYLNSLTPKARKEVLMSELKIRFKYIPSIPAEEDNSIAEQLLTSKVTEVLQMLNNMSLLQQRIAEARNIILNDKKYHDNEEVNIQTTSLINNNSNQIVSQKEIFLKAINKLCPNNSGDILDHLMTLSHKERSLCLFNEQYLNKKIIGANAALKFVNTNYEQYKETEEFMENLKNKPFNEQQKKLGDRLFPKIKNFGLKSAIASKVALNLLDTNDLYELAHSMNDKEKLKQMVIAAINVVQPK
ncbi:hypothetical protein C1645_807611 [Glomus cerebriforme]|uniref:PABC domain-containing protein n=1 Tax=Glomus cerebriforme TaxID=658196 RepID=A0A397SLB0_9GLOM|nr:hypothetical protein C1645_807611 [Glomus cerebriforme]